MIDWYETDTDGTPLLSASNTFTTPVISETTTYYAEARYADGGEVSARVPVTATVKMYEGEINGNEL